MAAANLQLSPRFIEQFELAQKSSIRWIQVKIDTVTFDVVNVGQSSGDLEKDLADARAKFDAEACMLLVCVDEDKSPKQWVIVAYVPQTSVVKKRMLYASGRLDIKTKLGQQYFRGEAYCGEASELVAANVLREKQDYADLAYTMEELTMKEEHAQSARPGLKAEQGMAKVEFGLTQEMEIAIQEFDQKKIDFICCKVEKDEKIHLVEKTLIGDISKSIASKIEEKEPRFYLIRRLGTPVGDQTYLVFSCPENSQIKLRMVYSTCKATLLEVASIGGVKFRLLEVQGGKDLDDRFKQEEAVNEDAGKIVHKDIVKPRAPGRRG